MPTNIIELKEELKKFLEEKLELLTEDLAKQFANNFGKGTFIDLPVNYLLAIQKETNFFQLDPNGEFCHFNGNLSAGEGEVVETFGFKVFYKNIPFTFSVKMKYYASDWGVEFDYVYLIELQTEEELKEEFEKQFSENPLTAYFALTLR